MYSSENEFVPFEDLIDTNMARGNVDEWLCWTEEKMIEAVKAETFKANEEYVRMERS